MEAKFTRQELDMLFEAVEKWERDDAVDEIVGAMMEGMFGDKSPEVKEKIRLEKIERDRKKKEALKLRKERGCLLRAKLVMIRDSMDAERVFDEQFNTSPR